MLTVLTSQRRFSEVLFRLRAHTRMSVAMELTKTMMTIGLYYARIHSSVGLYMNRERRLL